jgi:hypothetical protein
MPTETLVLVAAIVGVFGFFACVIAVADLTWRPHDKRESR